MPFAEITGGALHYRTDGDPHAPTLLLAGSIGSNLTMWDRQAAALANSFHVVRYDSRGHGRSLVTEGPYSMELLACDAVALLDHLKISQAHFCGLSLGGMVGMWLAAHEPARVNKLILANTAAVLGPPDFWNARMAAVRQAGMEVVADGVIERWLTAAFRQRFPADVEAARNMLLTTPSDGYIACCAAIRDMDLRGELTSIHAPTLVLVGRDDPATPPAAGRAIADGIMGARVIELPASHLSNIEAAEAFNATLLDFLLS